MAPPSAPPSAPIGSLYEKYKRATQEVVSYLSEKSGLKLRRVKDLVPAAQSMTSPVPVSFLMALWTAIRLRKMAQGFYSRLATESNESDARHAYFITTLERLWRLLKRTHLR